MKYPDRTMSRMIALTLSWLLSLQPLLVYADTRVVPQAGSGTTMDSSASQVPVVNIARPNSRGLSQNLYTRFDVGERGVVLNNSRAVTNTSIAGHITANPNLTTGHASIILNEVIQPNPSSLRGYLEVGGQNADVIVANPWGITCDGCGFINTQRGTLTTGRSLIGEDGSLLGFDIRGGEVAFEGRGLNARNMDYFSVLAQGIRLNAELYGSNLHLLGGEFQIDYDTLEVTATSHPDTPRYAISSSELGGIYGDSIRLIATGEGVGVHLDAPVAAQTGSVVIDAEGSIRFARVSAAEHILAASDETITAEGDATAGGTFHASAKDVHFTDGASGAEYVELQADTVTLASPASLVADNMHITADTLDNAGVLAAGDTLLLQLQRYEHGGDVQADGHLVIASAQDIHIGAMESGPAWQVAGDVTLLAGEAVHNEGVLSSAGTLTLEAGQVVNEGDMAGMQGVTLRAGVINNQSQSLLLSGEDMRLEANVVFNHGDIYAVENLAIQGLPAAAGDPDTGTSPETAVPWAQQVINASGLIGTQYGSIDIFADNIANIRDGDVELDVLPGVPVITWPDDRGEGAAKNEQCFHRNKSSGCKIRTYRQSTTTEYVAEEQLAALSPQAVILAGGDLTIHGHTLSNQYSAIGSYGNASIHLHAVDDAVASDIGEAGESGLPTHPAGGVLNNQAWVQELIEQTVIDSSRYREGSRGGWKQKKKKYIYSTIPRSENPQFCDKDLVRCRQDQQHRVVFDPVIHIQTLLSAVIGAAGTLNIVGEQISNGEIDQGLSFMAAQQFMQGDAPSGDGLYRLDPLGSGFTLPGTNGLFVRAQNPHHPYLIETNPLFATHSGFMGSSYMLNRLGWHPEPGQQLLGDAFYELNLLQQALLGQPAPIGADQETREQFFTRLMDQGIAAAESLQLSPGISLTAEQINTLQEDIIWLEEREVAGHRVLVPVVYLAQGVAAPDAILHGNTVVLEAGSISNGGLIQSQDDLTLKATDGSIHTSGTLQAGNTLTLDASENIINLGGTLRGHDIDLDAGGDIQLVTAHEHQQHGAHGITLLGNQATVEATGTLSMNSGGNTVLVGAQIDAGRLDVAAEGDVVAEAIAILRNYNANSKNADARLSSVRHLTTNIGTALDALISTEQNLTLIGVNLTAGGDINLQAEGDLVASAVKDEFYQYTRSVSTSGFGSGDRTTVINETHQTTHHGNQFVSGGNVSMQAGNDLSLTGGDVQAAGNIELNAGGELSLLAVYDSDYTHESTSKRGSFGASKKKDAQTTNTSTAQVVSLSAGGNVTVTSTGDQHLEAIQVAAGENISIRSEEGEVYFAAVKDTDYLSVERERSDLAWQKMSGSGHLIETLQQAGLSAGGEIVIEAAQGIRIDIPEVSGQQDVRDVIDAMVSEKPELAWLQELEASGEIDWQQVKVLHDTWDYEHEGMGEGLAIGIAIVVTALTSGAGAALVNGVAGVVASGATAAATAAGTTVAASTVAGGLAAAMTGAVITGATNQVVAGTINNGGRLDSAVSDLGSKDSLKGLGTAALTAGLMLGMDHLFNEYVQFGRDGVVQSDTTYGLTKGFNLGSSSGALGFTLHNTAQAITQAGVNSAVWGGSFNDHLKTSLENQGNDVLSALAFYQAGNLADNMPSTVEQMSWWKEGGAGKILLHAGVGGLVTEITHGDFASGAGAAAMNQILSPGMENLSEKWRPAGSQLAGMIGAGLTGGNYELGSWIGLQADAYNRQLHPEEKMLAKVLAKESNGGFTANEVEEALRWMPNKDKGELAGSNIVVDLQSEAMQGEGWKSLYYDHDGNWILLPGEDGEPRYMVQMPDEPVSPEIRDFIVSRTGGESSPYYDPAVYLPASRAQESGFSPTPLVLVAGGREYELTGINRDQACGSSRDCLATISSTPWHMGLIPVEQNGTTYYINAYDSKARAYLDKVYETTFQNMADAATVATIAFPVLAPATGPLAAGFTGVSLYYSDDKWGKGVDIGVGLATKSFWRWSVTNGGGNLSASEIIRMESILEWASGKASGAVREDLK